jgi:hypothetical protein
MTLQYCARSTIVPLKSKASVDDLRRALQSVGVPHAFRRESDGDSQ